MTKANTGERRAAVSGVQLLFFPQETGEHPPRLQHPWGTAGRTQPTCRELQRWGGHISPSWHRDFAAGFAFLQVVCGFSPEMRWIWKLLLRAESTEHWAPICCLAQKCSALQLMLCTHTAEGCKGCAHVCRMLVVVFNRHLSAEHDVIVNTGFLHSNKSTY